MRICVSNKPEENVQPTCQLQQDSTEDGRAGTDVLLTLLHAARLPPGG